MNRLVLPLLATVFAYPLHAQSLPPALSDWQGVYLGAQIEVIADSEFSSSIDPTLTGEFEGTLYGGFVGYRYQYNNFVVGGEFDIVGGSNEISQSGMFLPFSVNSDPTILRLGAEAGYAFGRFLPYGTAGFVYWDLEAQAGENDATGNYFGLGLDYQTGIYTSVGFEVLRNSVDDFDLVPDQDLEFTTLGVNFSIRY